ncbi:MAG: CBS domain-containing protein [Pseudomonadota bacterium]|nr:MAG: histidine kinase [Pseudomonadota bacterium]
MQPIRVPVTRFTTTDVVAAKENMNIDELQRLMERHSIRHLPVVRDGVAVGIISDRDVRLIAGMSVAEKFQMTAGDLMTPDPVAVKASATLDEAVELMAEKKVGSVLVNDEDGRLMGIFTATDALKALVDIIRNGGKLPA